MPPTRAQSPLWQLCKASAAGILQDAQDARSSEAPISPETNGLVSLPTSALSGFIAHSASVNRLLSTQHSSESNGTEHASLEELSQTLGREIESTYKRFYDFVYQDLPYCWRQLYTDLSILRFIVMFAMSPYSGRAGQVDSERHSELLDSMVSVLDKALILAGGAGTRRGRKTIEEMLRLLEDSSQPIHAEGPEVEERLAKRQKTHNRFTEERSFYSTRIFTPPTKHLVKRFDGLSMDEFQKYMDDGHASGGDGPLPFIVRGLMDEWPAMTTHPWRKPSYLLSKTFGGRRLVPVEVGRSYVDDGWGQELITFRELLKRIEDSVSAPESSEKSTSQAKPLSYLAQHELFTQLPSLRNDIPTPDLCYTSPPPHPTSPSLDKPELPLPLINAWFGPAGTITPLHTDGYHNLLAQVVGAKYVRLYSPVDSEALCPRGEDEHGIDMHNTSAYDVGVVEGWDEPPAGEGAQDDIELEEFRGLGYWEAVLEEGDVLYVPIGWWHYVRSLSVSFSVSFWWNGPHGSRTPEAEE